jgi:PKD repeat protein
MKIFYYKVFFSIFQFFFLSQNNYSQINLPWIEGFENVGPITTLYNDSYPINGLPEWSYDEVDFRGRLRFEMGSEFYHSGSKAATLDKTSTSYFLVNTNYLILELDLSNYFLSNDLELSFYHMHHNDMYVDDFDKVWIRGSHSDKWILIYNLVANQGSAGVWRHATGLDIDATLAQANPPQTVTSTFQVRFGQEGFNSTVSTEYLQGRTFDDISITGTLCGHPPVFNASVTSSTEIELNWTKNQSDQNVIIAVNSTNTFGNPVNGSSYTPGNTLSGGGTIVYLGAAFNYLHTNLNPNTPYYYKAWSYSEEYNYSCGIEDDDLTPCNPIVAFPYTEDFENGGTIPDCWRQEYVSGDNVDWVFIKGNKGKTHPEDAHSGTHNACLQDTDDDDDQSMLISPPFDFSTSLSATLSFWHTQEFFFTGQDDLSVFYRTSAVDPWILLETYTNSIITWTNESVNLPDLSSSYYIAFRGNAKYGYGLCIDDFTVNANVVSYPIANFSASITTPYISQPVTFTDLSNNNPTSWAWSFLPVTVTFLGGTDANSQNPQVQFNESGNYTVELIAANAYGNDTETKPDYISVFPKPVADFSADITSPAIGEIVSFTDLSTNNPTSWTWSFLPVTVTFVGGTDANSQNPQVQFNESGNYTVELTATNTSGNDLETKPDYISALPKPLADFSADIISPATGEIVSFTDLSTNNPTSWTWSFLPVTVTFVEGTDANSQNPQVQFNESGNYTVELTATNASGYDLETKTDYISASPKPLADFSADIISPAIGEVVSFTDLSTNNPTSWVWSILPVTVTFVGGTDANSQNPQVQFNESGNYTVELISTNTYGNDTETKPDYISAIPKPLADFNADITLPAIGEIVSFTDLSTNNPTSWAWSFLPVTVTYVGGTDANFQNPQVQFDESGNYTVELTATNTYGNDTETKTDYISVLPIPVTDFSADITSPAIGETVSFTDLSTNSPTSWTWSFLPVTVTFVGGTDANSQNPQVQFNESGNYTVELTATNASGYDLETKTDYISVIPIPVTDFSADITSPAIGEIVSFTDLSTNNPTSWAWSFLPVTVTFVGGTDANSQNPQVQFNESGNYTVELTATNASGYDLESKTDYISVIPIPVTDFSADITSPAVGEVVSFTDLSTNNPISWAWSFLPLTVTFVGGTDANSQNPQVQFNESGNYTVELTATNASGYDNEIKTDYIVVQNPEIIVDLTVFLEGPFNDTDMNTDLTDLTNFPFSQPYNIQPWNYTGNESIESLPNPDIVDWVMVELRDATNALSATSSTIVSRQAAFLLINGKIVGMDGISNLQFNISIDQHLFVVIWHRNHLGVLSSDSLTETGGIYTYNFTDSANKAYSLSNDGQKEIGSGIWGMFGGDGDRNGTINNFDKSTIWEIQSGTEGYLESDYNLDRNTNNKDKNDIWQSNFGKESQVPNL